MKKIALISALALSGLFYNTANAQIRIGLGLHINTPAVRLVAETPVYADYSDDYYYLPDVDAYYSVAEQSYYYNDGARWISAAYLPGAYHNYDWRTARRYEVRAHRPYLNADLYRERYSGNVGNWGRADSRYDNHFDNRAYANRDFGRDNHRDNSLQFERRNDVYRGGEHADNRGWDNGNRRDDHFDNRGGDRQQGNFGQSDRRQQGGFGQTDRGQQGNFNQQQQGRGQDNNNQPNRNQGGNFGQPSQQQGAAPSQPSRQNGGGQQQRGNGGGEQHFTDNHSQNGHNGFRS